MTPTWFIVAALAGGTGAATRFVLDGLIGSHVGSNYPIGTTAINVSGSFLLGLLTALSEHVLPHTWFFVLGTGLLGGYTTFSTASWETVRLARTGRLGLALMNGVGMMVLAVAAAAAGYGLGQLS